MRVLGSCTGWDTWMGACAVHSGDTRTRGTQPGHAPAGRARSPPAPGSCSQGSRAGARTWRRRRDSSAGPWATEHTLTDPLRVQRPPPRLGPQEEAVPGPPGTVTSRRDRPGRQNAPGMVTPRRDRPSHRDAPGTVTPRRDHPGRLDPQARSPPDVTIPASGTPQAQSPPSWPPPDMTVLAAGAPAEGGGQAGDTPLLGLTFSTWRQTCGQIWSRCAPRQHCRRAVPSSRAGSHRPAGGAGTRVSSSWPPWRPAPTRQEELLCADGAPHTPQGVCEDTAAPRLSSHGLWGCKLWS